jgi:hypothetical protein
MNQPFGVLLASGRFLGRNGDELDVASECLEFSTEEQARQAASRRNCARVVEISSLDPSRVSKVIEIPLFVEPVSDVFDFRFARSLPTLPLRDGR